MTKKELKKFLDMSLNEFDQGVNGWRVFENKKEYLIAAKLIHIYK